MQHSTLGLIRGGYFDVHLDASQTNPWSYMRLVA